MRDIRKKCRDKKERQRALIDHAARKEEYPNKLLRRTLGELETGVAVMGCRRRKFLQKMLVDGRVFEDYKARIRKILKEGESIE